MKSVLFSILIPLAAAAAFKEVDPANLTTEIGVNTSFITTDDIGLVFFQNRADLNKAVVNLEAHKTDLRIDQLIYGQQQIDLGFGNAMKDPAVLDTIVQPIKGIIYTTSKSKIAEHGGGSIDDRLVAYFSHNPRLHKQTFNGQLYTTQVAPTILKALGLDPQKLQGADAEGTQPLPGLEGW